MNQVTRQIIVKGLIQGVGFRPFVFRIAILNDLSGWVMNTNENVIIRVTGQPPQIENFLEALAQKAPAASSIENIDIQHVDYEIFSGFSIRKSADASEAVTEISPDIMVCPECIEDMQKPGKRKNYPFVNCTNCGPRFTIIEQLPYDRFHTSMHPFSMCPGCRSEYDDVSDRRFHAQPTACNQCGPLYNLQVNELTIAGEQVELFRRVAGIIDDGGAVVMKGLGGMNLVCDAFSEEPVSKLRKIKHRDGKPFAIMVRDAETLKKFAVVSPIEEQSLLSWKRPIVLLELISGADLSLAPGVCAGLNQVGAMLPYLPAHYMLFNALKTNSIVFTSGNLHGEPILIGNEKAQKIFLDKVDALFLHNREILNRTDDSVVKIIGGVERLIRRSRGFAPAPVRTELQVDGIVACGAELAGCFCVGKENKAIFSQYIGDLDGLETQEFFMDNMSRYLKLFRIKPTIFVADLHPNYWSTKYAFENRSVPVLQVQHHHAHIAACMAEHHLDEKVIGIALDGTGLGTDGHSWGSEFMIADLHDFHRKSHFEYLPMPGGDRGAEEPWRMAVAWLYQIYGSEVLKSGLPFLRNLDPDSVNFLCRMIRNNINCPLSCSAGRYFDATAGLLNLCMKATFHAEGPMRLEAAADRNVRDQYSYRCGETIILQPMLKEIIQDMSRSLPVPVIAAKFHNTIISVIFETAIMLRNTTGLNKVAVSGGVFQNRFILEKCTARLLQAGFEVYAQTATPANDGGIALGQIAIASKKRDQLCV